MADYISSFTITVVCMVILSFVLRALMPQGSLGKYVEFVIGTVVSITIAGSFANIQADSFENITDIPYQSTFTKEDAQALYNERIIENFKINFTKRVQKLVKENTNIECEVEIMISVDTDGAILGVDGIYVRMYDACDTENVKNILSRELEVDKQIIHIGGAELD
ncbi:MAG: hypothetical protein E7410_05080 [Ruminococcaceae bacterium]|nr:hypothetical protein [Oscillospiraceae bacterium]